MTCKHYLWVQGGAPLTAARTDWWNLYEMFSIVSAHSMMFWAFVVEIELVHSQQRRLECKSNLNKVVHRAVGGYLTFDLLEINSSGVPRSNGPEAECVLDLCLSVY